ncbi:NEDD8 ultimate buster 1-like [Brachionus plicatilis]|uniref:NEDD8 ultimate buster 1-like n=1 Tax=Brachionus plicatilis TaxID=10195 RepID=A0A3M7PMC2_BRAPC|nr:NEDD8 ultimate buster 1-like [Brachionus plicatilis]
MVNKYTPIFVRLNLLKAILKYYRGKKNETRQFLDTAMQEMKKILVDDDKVAEVMSMGFSNTEAKLALRATFNNVDAAVEQIFKSNVLCAQINILVFKSIIFNLRKFTRIIKYNLLISSSSSISSKSFSLSLESVSDSSGLH